MPGLAFAFISVRTAGLCEGRTSDTTVHGGIAARMLESAGNRRRCEAF